MVRSFLPVGQGAFYLEQFEFADEKLNVIYDCGSSTDVGLAIKQIHDNFEKGEKIQAVFISHLDDDHINALPYLLEYCQVENMFFPLITETHRKLILVDYLRKYHTNSENDFLYQFMLNPYNVINDQRFQQRPNLFQIAEYNTQDNEERFNGIDVPVIRAGENVTAKIKGSKSELIPSMWEYIPFNFRQKSRIEDLFKALCHEFGYEVNVDDLQWLWKENALNRKRIKNAYRVVKGSFNTNSMTLFSGVRNENIEQQLSFNSRSCYSHSYPCYCNKRATINGCLYTGDYDASGTHKWMELQNAYRQYLKYIGCIQVPHHGSRHNYNHELTNFNAFYIISAGYKNIYQHPHSSVLKDMLFEAIHPFIVNEHRGSAVYLIID